VREWGTTVGKLLGGWIVLVAATGGLLWLVATVTDGAVQAADEWMLRRLHEVAVPWLMETAHAVTMMGKPAAAVPLTVFAVLAFYFGLGRRRDAVWITLSSIGAGSAYLLLLPLVARPRPQLFTDASGLSMPSGHVVAVMSVALPVAVAGWRLWGRRSWPLCALALGVVVAIGLTRPYIQYHWVTDVVVAWSMTAAWVWWVDRALPRSQA